MLTMKSLIKNKKYREKGYSFVLIVHEVSVVLHVTHSFVLFNPKSLICLLKTNNFFHMESPCVLQDIILGNYKYINITKQSGPLHCCAISACEVFAKCRTANPLRFLILNLFCNKFFVHLFSITARLVTLHISNYINYLIIVLIIYHNICNNLLFPVYSDKHLSAIN